MNQTLLINERLKGFDLASLDKFRQAGFCILVHGSIVTAPTLNKNSDIDFTAIGEINLLLNNEGDNDIDYIAWSKINSQGRKISVHLQPPSFRMNYHTKPFAAEYRSVEHKKQKSEYILGSVSRNGDVHLLALTCPKYCTSNGTVTHTPQTGIFFVQNDMAISGSTKFGFQGLLTNKASSGKTADFEMRSDSEFMLIGLELNKISEDIPLDTALSNTEYQKYIATPIAQCLSLIHDYIQNDPVKAMIRCLRLRSDLRARIANKTLITQEFVRRYENRLRKISHEI